jgi:putative ABC transport system permease protein
MKLVDLILFIFENLSRQRGRVILTSLGVTIGSSAIILLVALVSGLQKSTTAQFTGNKNLTQITVNTGFGRFNPGGGSSVRTNNQTTTQLSITNDVVAQFAAMDHVVRAIPTQSVQGGASLTYQRYTGRASITGIALDDLSLLGYTAAEGRLTLGSGDVVIGAEVPNNFYRANYSGSDASLTTDLLGKTLQLTLSKTGSGGVQRKTFRLHVAGILESMSSQADYALYIPMNDADTITAWVNGARVNHDTYSYSGVIVEVDKTNNVTTIADSITTLGYQAQTPASFLANVNSLFTALQLVFGGVGAITLLVAAIGIANTMTMAILERTKEIGLLKALGASNQDILKLFLGESAGIGLIGGIGGIAIGLILGTVINAIAIPYLQSQATTSGTTSTISSAVYIPWYLPVFALVFSTVIGILSGLYPSLRAASLAPVIALRNE